MVVTTRDRPRALERCMTALTWQTARSMEIVVVDDGSVDFAAIGEAVAGALRAAGGAPPTHVVEGPGLGPAAARNLGARTATGAIVCFTDDDCVPVPRWAQHLAEACAGGGAAAGTTVADPLAGRAAAAAQLIAHVLQLCSLDPETSTLAFAPACNLACPAGVARDLPFDESPALAAGVDRDWCSRLAAAGVPLRFVPEARVEHLPSMGVGELLREHARYGRCAARLRAAADRRLCGPEFYGRLARAAVRAGPRVAALVALAQAAVAAGSLLGGRAAGSRR